jgi:hypothetical protein
MLILLEVPPDVRESYTKIIDGILAGSDLNTISEKRIRKGLQESVGYDLTPQKVRVLYSGLAILTSRNSPLVALLYADCIHG